jgi:F-type H+-transporting ATPase subunit delta
MVELIAKRYGTAIYQLAIENDQIDVVSSDLALIKHVFDTEVDFVKIVNHPKIVVEEKIVLMESVFKGKISSDVLGLIILTIIKGRQSHLIDIIDYCETMFDAYNNIVTAHVTSPDPLLDSEKDQMKQRLEMITGKTVITEYDINETLIGGLVVRIGDRIIDNSIKGKLAQMSKTLLEA